MEKKKTIMLYFKKPVDAAIHKNGGQFGVHRKNGRSPGRLA